MNPFSRRTDFEASENAFTQAITRARQNGAALLDLSVSNPTAVGLSLDGDTLIRALTDPGVAKYAPEPFGLGSAREALSAELATRGYGVPAAQIMLTSSTSEAYGYLFKLLCDPGDAVLVPAPSYPLLDVLANLEGVRLIPYRLAYDGEWHLDRSLIELARSSGARAIVTVHPNNPTGSFIKRDELSILAECELPILSDEVFSDYALFCDERRAPSLLELTDSLVFCMGGLSKALLLPQLKLAWTLVSGPVQRVVESVARLEHIADTYLSPSTVVQLALPRLLSQTRAVQDALRARCLHNLTLLRATCGHDVGISVLKVEGRWMAILRLPLLRDEEGWALELLARHGVVTQPGYFYDLGSGCHLVLSLITPEEVFARGAVCIAQCVRDAMAGAS